MKPRKLKFASTLALLVFLSATQLASAFYDLSLGRWLNRDPLGESGFEILRGEESDVLGDGQNLFAYVINNPINEIDPQGLERDCATELIVCHRRCWNSTPPWPAKKHKRGHYAYCETKCLAEYMACEADNAGEKMKCKKWILIPFPLPRPIPLPKPIPVPIPAPA
jgi:RHS repeat-associated protein